MKRVLAVMRFSEGFRASRLPSHESYMISALKNARAVENDGVPSGFGHYISPVIAVT